MYSRFKYNYLFLILSFIQIIFCVNIDIKFPITFTYQKSNSNSRDYENINGSYFGYSLSAIQQNDNNFVLIGAPRHDSPKVSRTGAIFHCEWKVSQTNRDVICSQINFSSGITRNKYSNLDTLTTNMNLGSSLVGINSGFVGCAHLWVNLYKDPKTPIGGCYGIDINGKVLKSYGPDLNGRPPVTRLLRPLNADLMSGFSSVSPKTIEDIVILGAPGYYDYAGTVIVYADHQRLELDKILTEFNENEPQVNNYLGYSLTTGLFFGPREEYLVMGAPRDNTFNGKVLLIRLNNRIRNIFGRNLMEVSGEEDVFGEYFGASLLALDINNDKFDDLIVGAPFYSDRRNREIGRIYIFMMNKETLQFERERLIVGHKSVGRFGTAMSSIDINLDEYRDAIISAPYESNSDGSLGAIYIYLGSEKGLDSIPHTRIGAESMQNQVLNGFGISIVSNVDFDRNGYEDLLIGSYLSENAILLRTKPIAKLSLSNIAFKPNKIRLQTKETNCNNNKNFCFKVEYCVGYDGKHINNKQLALITLDITDKSDSKLRIKESRVKFSSNSRSDEKTVKLKSEKNCFESDKSFNLMVNEAKSLIDIITPIEVRLSVSLMNESSNSFCKDCPIAQSFATFANIEFEHGCQLKICTSRLTLTALSIYNGQRITEKQSLIEGLHDTIDINISVENIGEASINTAVDIKMTPILLDLTNSGDANRCNRLDNTSSYRCDVSQVLEKNKRQNLNLHFNVPQTPTNNIQIDFKVETNSKVEKGSKLSDLIKFEIIKSAKLKLISESINNFSYSDKTPKVPFKVLYRLIKSGPSSIFSAYLVFRLPADVVVVDSTTICKTTYYGNWARNLPQTNKTINLICDKTATYCSTFQCRLPKFPSDPYSATLVKPFVLSLALIPLNIRNRDFNGIKFQLNSEIKIEDKVRFEIEIKSNASNSVFMTRDVPIVDEVVEPWILFLSSGFGVFFLIIIVIILIKKGFFRRKKLEEIAKVKQRMSMRPDLYGIKDSDFVEEDPNQEDQNEEDQDETGDK